MTTETDLSTATAMPEEGEQGALEGAAADLHLLNSLAADDLGHLPGRLDPGQIEALSLFQTRDRPSEHHLSHLARALATVCDLAPVLVLACGGRFFLVDGHHRLEAYSGSGRSDGIPVRYFEGTPADAVLEAQRLNGMATLVLSNTERQNGAWKLVKLSCHSLSQMMAACGVSRGQLTTMRRVKRELGERASEYTSWHKALKASQGQLKDLTDEEIEDMLDQQARGYADRMAKALGTKPAANPELLARMLEMYTGRNVLAVIRQLQERNEDPFADDEDPFADDEEVDF